MGGEKRKIVFHCTKSEGSPPRGRGKGAAPLKYPICIRITPAWAGKRDAAKKLLNHSEDHPRVGGEKYHPDPIWMKSEGSPPRGRGKVQKVYGYPVMKGITPAWAGKSAGHLYHCQQSGDHPRVGGEKRGYHYDKVNRQGSPPRGRGKVHNLGYEYTYLRITPAWAGKSYRMR